MKIHLLCLLLLPVLMLAAQPSPYVGDTSRRIKALSENDINGYLTGQGMGLARAAELNRYPGPRHALELAGELELTTDQVTRLQQAFQIMDKAARTAGTELVAREAELDRLFAEQRASTAEVVALSAEIGRIQGVVRAAHLNAHVATVAILTPHQVNRYVELRGYNRPSGDAPATHDPTRHKG